jgi:hypothetical protein
MSLLDTASLIVTPNGYKEGKLYSVIPSDGSGDMSVVRATTATRVNSAGLVELVPYNLLGYSEDFTNASWLKGASTITGNTTTSPNGTLTADTFSGNGASDLHIVLWQTDVIGVGNTISVYAKKNTNDFLQIYTDFVNTDFANFNLANGTTGSVGSSVISSAIESVGNGWYRCSFVVGSASSKYVNFCLVTSSTAGRAETNSLSTSVFLWGAQLNEGTLLPYQKTETRLNIPRLDYSNGTCPSLLVEPQRTNVVLNSENFSNASWSNQEITIVSNSDVAPNGTTSADKLIPTAVSSAHQLTTGNIISSSQCSFGVYAKSAGYTTITILDQAIASNGASFNLSNGTATTIGTATATITDVGNGWYRCSVVATTTGMRIYVPNSASNFVGDGTSGVLLWGAQLEAGSYATSYIPTTSASVTRNADVISKTGISSLIGQTEGTLFVDLEDFIELDIPCLTIDNGTNDNRIVLYREFGTGYLGLFLAASGTIVTALSTTSASDGKIAIAYTGTTFVMYRNGVQIVSTTSAIPSSMSAVRFNGRATNDFYTTRKIKSFALWKTRLTNTQLATLTSL